MTSTPVLSREYQHGWLTVNCNWVHPRVRAAPSRYLEHNVAGQGYRRVLYQSYVPTVQSEQQHNNYQEASSCNLLGSPTTNVPLCTHPAEGAHRSPYYGQAVSATLRGQPHASFTYRGFFERTSNQDYQGGGWSLVGPGRLTCDGILRREGQIHHPLRQIHCPLRLQPLPQQQLRTPPLLVPLAPCPSPPHAFMSGLID